MPSTPKLRLPTFSVNNSPRVAKSRGVTATTAAAKKCCYTIHFYFPPLGFLDI